MSLTIRQMQHEAFIQADKSGFHENYRSIGDLLMLIVTELAEAMEDVRHDNLVTRIRYDGKPEGLPSEIADVIIRCGDLAGVLDFDLESEVRLKMDYNAKREYQHGGKRL